MDESWRMKMGMPTTPPPERRRSTVATSLANYSKDPTVLLTRRSTDSCHVLDPDDFSDVFGGPPRTLLSRSNNNNNNNNNNTSNGSSSSSSTSSSFYQEVFPKDTVKKGAGGGEGGGGGGGGGGRSLPAFRIPAAKGEGFYDDVFGVKREDGDKWSRPNSKPKPKPKSKSKSKSNSSSVLSSEEISPPRPNVSGDDVALSSFASKLRPINVPYRWNSATMVPEEQFKKQEMPSFPRNLPSYSNTYHAEDDHIENFRSSFFKFSRQVSSPETMEPASYPSIKASADDLELNSPASPVSSLCQEAEPNSGGMQCNAMQEEESEWEEDEIMSSYVIEISSDHREGTAEAVSVDEAIAWAKEKFQSEIFETKPQNVHSTYAEERPNTQEAAIRQQMDVYEGLQSLSMETELLDEDIRSWSAGKQTNIRLLLSTLHHVLWPDSGWYAVPLASLIENSQVKKAYQKARLCLHPDKLQQRGATFAQKYVAEKAFPILQVAWAAFISQDLFFD